ncbi:SDR family oxidoreductase [Rhodococcoides fascians]|uniref:SDR family oxidoreductase n=1 Tax=Rhodococcoides fascians TaxID=1828 RepID=UPI00050CB3D7|nr:SDR family oxidoreductase [Rhodococcus fascians]AMY54536.1 3-oxoacyl-[acyl-carrier-protein] reductase FabG [Rhodococcus fascians D188]
MRVLVIGGASGIGRAVATEIIDSGGSVVLAGRRPDVVERVVSALGDRASALTVDLSDEESIAAAAATVGAIDHVVSLAADHANGPIGELDVADIRKAFDAKVIGPIQLAKHFGGHISEGGSLLFFSGVAAWKPAPGLSIMSTTNGAVSFLVEALAVELAPIRVNAVSPGIVDSGAWDAMGDGKQSFFEETARANPAGRVGRPADVVATVLYALTATFVTGTTLHVDGGGRLS